MGLQIELSWLNLLIFVVDFAQCLGAAHGNTSLDLLFSHFTQEKCKKGRKRSKNEAKNMRFGLSPSCWSRIFQLLHV